MVNEEIISAAELAEFQIVTNAEAVGMELAATLEKQLGLCLPVTGERIPGKRGILIGTRPFCDYGGSRCAVCAEQGDIYLDGGSEETLRRAAELLLESLTADGTVSGRRYGYRWPEMALQYNLKWQKQEKTRLCPGVQYLHRSYLRADGKPVEAFIVIADPDSPAKAAVWGCPQGESMVVPEQVAWMNRVGKNVIAAVNADFFHFFNNGDKTTFGAQIIDGVVYKEPNAVEHYGENWFGLTGDGRYVISDLQDYRDNYRGRLEQAVGGGVWLIRDGKVCFHSSPAVEPRTAVAVTEAGGLVIVCVDGRSEESVGATYTDLTQIFMDLDMPVKDALNLDGGHSTILMTRREDGRMEITNRPSSGLDALRPVADILTLVLP